MQPENAENVTQSEEFWLGSPSATSAAGFSLLADADETAGPGRCCHS